MHASLYHLYIHVCIIDIYVCIYIYINTYFYINVYIYNIYIYICIYICIYIYLSANWNKYTLYIHMNVVCSWHGDTADFHMQVPRRCDGIHGCQDVIFSKAGDRDWTAKRFISRNYRENQIFGIKVSQFWSIPV